MTDLAAAALETHPLTFDAFRAVYQQLSPALRTAMVDELVMTANHPVVIQAWLHGLIPPLADGQLKVASQMAAAAGNLAIVDAIKQKTTSATPRDLILEAAHHLQREHVETAVKRLRQVGGALDMVRLDAGDVVGKIRLRQGHKNLLPQVVAISPIGLAALTEKIDFRTQGEPLFGEPFQVLAPAAILASRKREFEVPLLQLAIHRPGLLYRCLKMAERTGEAGVLEAAKQALELEIRSVSVEADASHLVDAERLWQLCQCLSTLGAYGVVPSNSFLQETVLSFALPRRGMAPEEYTFPLKNAALLVQDLSVFRTTGSEYHPVSLATYFAAQRNLQGLEALASSGLCLAEQHPASRARPIHAVSQQPIDDDLSKVVRVLVDNGGCKWTPLPFPWLKVREGMRAYLAAAHAESALIKPAPVAVKPL